MRNMQNKIKSNLGRFGEKLCGKIKQRSQES